MHAVEDLLRVMIPPQAENKCKLYSSLTDSGNISLILEALNPGDHQDCKDALLLITNTINRNKTVRNIHPKFEMAAFISLESWARNQLIDIQDQILNAAEDLKDQTNVKLADTVQDIDNKVQGLPVGRGWNLDASALVYTYVSSSLSLILLLH